MNVDRGKESFTDAEVQELRDWTREYMSDRGWSWKVMGGRSGVPGGTLSQWVPGTYTGDNRAIAARMHRFRLHVDAQEAVATHVAIAPAFQSTPTAKEILGVLAYAHRGNMALIVGQPGLSKTASIKQYAATNPNVWVLTASPAICNVQSVLLSLYNGVAQEFGRFSGSNLWLTQQLRSRAAARRALIVIDEAQHLEDKVLEELRAIHDTAECGLVLVGNPKVLTRVEGAAREAAFAQLYSRVSVRLVLGKPKPADVEILLNAWSIEDPKEREFLQGIAMRAGGGALRQLTKVLEYATLLAQSGDEEERVLSHLKEASAALSQRAAA